MILKFFILFLNIFIKLLYWAIFINIIMSWFASGKSTLGHFLDQIVRPILWPFRWARIGMIDFSPVLALIALDFLGGLLIEYLSKFIVQ